ncbi:protein kinase domain-containing protein [Streptomyces sp. SBT349]|uniref:protein kinase domain-containing protein n=1 Tax=Streptomyces sp. SBT349 TaxID=1580539 RepID=UPI00066BC70C|nr:protein kinase [Streptomyces sp. SBT349]
MSAGPYEPTEDIRLLLRPRSSRLVMNRRGSSVWRVTDEERRRHAVKLGYVSSPTHTFTALAPAREAAILRQLGREGIHWGEWEHGTWSVQPWRNGESLWELWEGHREGSRDTDTQMAEALSCAKELAQLHDAGWVHGDVQPHHFIIGDQRTHVIDLGLAHGGDIPEAYDFPFRGCLVMYESPEISRSVLEQGYAVPTRESDVFGLGASLFISVTGLRAVEFPPDAEREEQRRVIAKGHHRKVTIPGPLGSIVEAMLSPVPTDRPTVAQVCDALT